MTIEDIAKEAGVSKATVSRVLNDRAEGVGPETRLRVKAVIESRGFEPSGFARGLATGRSRTVGLVIPDIANPFFPLLVRGIEDALRGSGYGLFLCDSDGDAAKEEEHLRLLAEKRVDGVLLSSAFARGRAARRGRRSVPCVLVDRLVEAPGGPGAGVFVDNRGGARMAAEYLLAGGSRRLLFINGPRELGLSALRAQGVDDALASRGLGPEAALRGEGDYTVEGGERAALAALGPGSKGGEGAFDAVFAANDMMAIGAMRALARRGIRVPGEVEVVGFDDVETARLVEPPLTTVAQPAFEMGREGARLLLRLIDGRRPRARTIVMEPTLVVRGSTRPR